LSKVAPTRRLIVDGMNVVGSRPDGWWRDRQGAMRRLVSGLGALSSDVPIVVVFDGAPFGVDPADGVEVRFASRRGQNAADDDIAAMAGAGDTVVTSDADLSRRVRERGAEVVGAGEFRTRLDG
jgi:predicted RNA-binding protein with PIN domain